MRHRNHWEEGLDQAMDNQAYLFPGLSVNCCRVYSSAGCDTEEPFAVIAGKVMAHVDQPESYLTNYS